MVSVSRSVDVKADQAAVWAVLVKPEGFPEWMTNHTRFVGDVPAELDSGTAFSQMLTVLSMPTQVAWTVATCDVGKTLTWTGRGPMGVRLGHSYTLTENGESTSVTNTVDANGGMVMAMAGRLKDELGNVAQLSLGKLKTIVEGGSAG